MMKIEGTSPNHETAAATTRLEQTTRTERQDRADKQAETGEDRVDISSDAQLMGQAVKAAEDSPNIRQDKVEQARQKLMAGEIGSDSLKLADRMIDHLLQQ
jgi:flagellar biosynthesis anti-sigma factor FlgM